MNHVHDDAFDALAAATVDLPPPLAMEREAVLDDYFTEITIVDPTSTKPIAGPRSATIHCCGNALTSRRSHC